MQLYMGNLQPWEWQAEVVSGEWQGSLPDSKEPALGGLGTLGSCLQV